MCDLRDDSGDNISTKNPTYCELTALYWLFKNENLPEYVGFNFYSRIFDINEDVLSKILLSGVDVIVPEPCILSHIRYMPKNVLLNNHAIDDFLEKAVAKSHPQYLNTYKAVIKERIVLPSNIFIARRDIFRSYCKWLFEVIDAYENFLTETEKDIPPRHIGYMAEILQTVYFLHNSSELNILFGKRLYIG